MRVRVSLGMPVSDSRLEEVYALAISELAQNIVREEVQGTMRGMPALCGDDLATALCESDRRHHRTAMKAPWNRPRWIPVGPLRRLAQIYSICPA